MVGTISFSGIFHHASFASNFTDFKLIINKYAMFKEYIEKGEYKLVKKYAPTVSSTYLLEVNNIKVIAKVYHEKLSNITVKHECYVSCKVSDIHQFTTLLLCYYGVYFYILYRIQKGGYFMFFIDKRCGLRVLTSHQSKRWILPYTRLIGRKKYIFRIDTIRK